MSWNYRVVHRNCDGEDIYAIHEVFYNPIGITENPCYPHGETLEKLKKDLECYLASLDRPVLEYEEDSSNTQPYSGICPKCRRQDLLNIGNNIWKCSKCGLDACSDDIILMYVDIF